MNHTISSLRRGLFATAFSLSTLTAVSAAGTFEGRIHMEVSSENKKDATNLDYAIKEGKMRMDMPQESSRRGSGSGGMIIDFPHQEMFILMDGQDGQKMFMRRSLVQPGAPARARNGGDNESAPPVPTGRTAMIAGYPATEYTSMGEKGETTELWLAKGLGTFMSQAGQGPGPMGGRRPSSPGWEKFARDGAFFPLRVVTRNAKGAEKSRMEVTKIEKTRLPDSLFSTEGYSEFQMPDFGSGFNPFKR